VIRDLGTDNEKSSSLGRFPKQVGGATPACTKRLRRGIIDEREFASVNGIAFRRSCALYGADRMDDSRYGHLGSRGQRGKLRQRGKLKGGLGVNLILLVNQRNDGIVAKRDFIRGSDGGK
jgi:hypothetical protein